MRECANIFESIPDTVREMHAAEPIREIPVTVLTPGNAAPLSDEHLERIGEHVRQVIALASEHWIHLDEPGLVIESIRELLAAVAPETVGRRKIVAADVDGQSWPLRHDVTPLLLRSRFDTQKNLLYPVTQVSASGFLDNRKRGLSMEVKVSHLDGVKFAIQARSHAIVCDQPPDNGGEDTGMTPPELLLASLGSCAAFYAVPIS